MKYECSRCGQVVEEIGKARHEQGRHQHHWVVGQRPHQINSDGSPELLNKSMGGLDIGPVEWTPIDK